MSSVRPTPAPPESPLKVIADATCTFCGCTCDDIDLTVAGDHIVSARHACAMGEAWFLSHAVDSGPSCRVEGQPATIETGLERAAQILTSARYPLIFGLHDTTCEAQRAATAVADWIGGTIDTPTSSEHGPTGVSFQGVGEVTSSLGEVANRSDLVLFWGTNPAVSLPRHFSRYSLEPKGMFVPRGRADRTCVVVDVAKTETAEHADLFLQIKPGSDFEALWVLRALALGVELEAARVAEDTGVTLAEWQNLIERMKQARFGVMFYGRGLSLTRGRYLNTEALLALVRDLNSYTRFVARSMRGRGNAGGADNVLAWTTGFPFGVNLSRGYPRFNPGEFTASEILARGEADAALIVGSRSLENLSHAARRHLATIPTVVVDPAGPTLESATVAFTTATCGIHTAGTVYRMDDVPLPLRPSLTSPHPSDVEILTRLERQVLAIQHATHPPKTSTASERLS